MFFDPNSVEDTTDFPVIPAGKYRFAVTEGSLKTTKKLDGKYVQITLQILSGDYKNRLVFSRFNIENPSEKAQMIGRAQFKQFLSSLGITSGVEIGDRFFGSLIGKTTTAEIVAKLGTDDVSRNEVKRFLPPVAQAPVAAAPERPQTAGRSTPQPIGVDDVPF